MNKLHHLFATLLGIVAGTLATSANATTVFADDTFDLTNYTISTYQTGGATINTMQTLSGGNPGAAVQSIISQPAASTFYTSQYLMNSSFLYDPGTQGAIQSVDFSEDTYLALQGTPLTGYSDTAILSQGGNYYTHTFTVPIITGDWQTGSQTGLQETDFDLVTDLLTLATDTTSHPDFTNGTIQFGAIMATSSANAPAVTVDFRIDNLSYTVNSVPLPAAVWLLGSGLLALIGVSRRKAT